MSAAQRRRRQRVTLDLGEQLAAAVEEEAWRADLPLAELLRSLVRRGLCELRRHNRGGSVNCDGQPGMTTPKDR